MVYRKSEICRSLKGGGFKGLGRGFSSFVEKPSLKSDIMCCILFWRIVELNLGGVMWKLRVLPNSWSFKFVKC
jgi:hypothetical protein